MIYFEMDSEGNLAANKILRKDFITSIDLNNIDLDPSKLIKYDIDCPDSIYRKVVLSKDEVLNQNRALVKLFLRSKKFEGCTKDTLNTYNGFLVHFVYSIIKPVSDIRGNDIIDYIIEYGEIRDVKQNTLDDLRRTLNGFFKWLEEEDYILKNPMRKIKKIRGEIVVKDPFTEEEIELIRDACITLRELALIDFLNTSGVRAQELCNLNIVDIDLDNRMGMVYGKGKKQRKIYFSEAAKVHLRKYLNRRKDHNPALFVTSIQPYNRLSKRGLEYILACIGERACVDDVHPHKFRRTLATRLLSRGMPVEQVQLILGHTKVETTLIYAKVSDQDVRINHTRYA